MHKLKPFYIPDFFVHCCCWILSSNVCCRYAGQVRPTFISLPFHFCPQESLPCLLWFRHGHCCNYLCCYILGLLQPWIFDLWQFSPQPNSEQQHSGRPHSRSLSWLLPIWFCTNALHPSQRALHPKRAGARNTFNVGWSSTSDHSPRKQWEAWTTVRFGFLVLSQQRCSTCCTPTMGWPPSSLASSASASPASSSPSSLFLRQEWEAGEKLSSVFKGQRMRPMCQLVFEIVSSKNVHFAGNMLFLAALTTYTLGEQVTF